MLLEIVYDKLTGLDCSNNRGFCGVIRNMLGMHVVVVLLCKTDLLNIRVHVMTDALHFVQRSCQRVNDMVAKFEESFSVDDIPDIKRHTILSNTQITIDDLVT